MLYIDEFTQYLDIEVGKDAIDLLIGLGYKVQLYFGESGRTFLSKGFLKQAKKCAEKNVEALYSYTQNSVPIIGLEPSAILSFRDEYHRFGLDKSKVESLSKNSWLLEEFLASEIKNGSITSDSFTKESKTIKIHAHCHQKSLSNQK